MSSQSSSSTRICRQFSLDEIKDARNHFGKSHLLGSGGEAKVYLTKVYIQGKDTRVAVKHFLRASNGLEKDIGTVHEIQHPHIVSLLGYCEDLGQLILVYEYMKNGALSSYVKVSSKICMTWQQRLRICLGAARGLQRLHRAGIIHRDVKPGNILIDANLVGKISDFGMFKLSDDDQVPTDLKGTRGYYAPEYNRGNKPTRKIDVYAFGVVLFEVLCLKTPWEDHGDESYYRRENDDLGLWALKNVDAEMKKEISEDPLLAYVDIIRGCLQLNPDERSTMDKVVQDLEMVLEYQKAYEDAQQFPMVSRSQLLRRREPVVQSSHVHNLVQLESDVEFTCDSCYTVGGGKRYRCLQGDFNAHEFCCTCPRSQKSFMHPQHTLNIVDSKDEALHLFCNVCDESINGQFYKCESNCDFEVHPLCTQLPQNVSHVLHPQHPLNIQTSAPSLCKVCNQECASWRYGCEVCSFNIHLECISKNSTTMPKNKNDAKVNKAINALVEGGIFIASMSGVITSMFLPFTAAFVVGPLSVGAGIIGMISWGIFKVFKGLDSGGGDNASQA